MDELLEQSIRANSWEGGETAHQCLSGIGPEARRGPGVQQQGGEVEQGHRADGRHEVNLRDSRRAGVLAAGPARRDEGGRGGGARPQRGVVEADRGLSGQRDATPARSGRRRRRGARHGSGGFLVGRDVE